MSKAVDDFGDAFIALVRENPGLALATLAGSLAMLAERYVSDSGEDPDREIVLNFAGQKTRTITIGAVKQGAGK